MTALPSIRQRLSQALVGISIVWGVAVSGVVWFAVHHEVGELLDSTLQESAEILFGLLSFNAAQLPLQGGGALPAPVHDEQLVWQIVDADQRVLLRSHRAPDQALVDRSSRGFSSVSDAWRVFAMPFDGNGRRRAAAREMARCQRGVIDLVRTRDDVELVGPDTGIHHHGAGQQIDTIDRASIQPLATDGDRAIGHV